MDHIRLLNNSHAKLNPPVTKTINAPSTATVTSLIKPKTSITDKQTNDSNLLSKNILTLSKFKLKKINSISDFMIFKNSCLRQ